MKKIAMALMLFFSALLGGGNDHVYALVKQDRATWLWDPWLIVKDEEGTIAFLESKKLNKVYVQIDSEIPITVYQNFIESASAKGMKIYALDGAPDWVAPRGYISQNILMKWLEAYQEEASSQQKFSGVHLDVEPYLYSGWNSKRGATVKSYQALLLRAKNAADKLNLPLEADMPFWFDEISYGNVYGKGLLAEWVIKNMDGVTIMAYRDSSAMIIDIVKKEVEWAGKYFKPLVVGVETGETSEGDAISFYEEGESFMNEQLQGVKDYYRNTAGFGGTAVHHVGSWMTIKP
ncbi:MAG: amidase [Bacillota bacterium]